jgi:hypothetical protein
MTLNSQAIELAIVDAMKYRKLIGVIGYPGAGKTTSIELLKSKEENIFSIQLGISVTAKAMYTKILRSISQTATIDKYSGIYGLSQIILHELREIPGNKVLMIDEAGFFTKAKVAYLLELYNLISDHCGIIVLGPDYYKRDLYAWRGVRGVDEFLSRISYFVELKKPRLDEIKHVLENEGFDIEKQDKGLYDEIKRNTIDRTWRSIEHIIGNYNHNKQQNIDG